MNNKVEIKWLKNVTSKASQIYSSGMEYCFISEDMKQCHPLVFCKDFLTDVVWSNLHGKPVSIYSFSYNPKEKPLICQTNTRIALANQSDSDFRNKIENVLDFVNKVSVELHIKRSVVYEVENSPKKYENGIFIFDGSAMWMNSPPLLSFYTLLLRVGFIHKKENTFRKTIEDVTKGKIAPYQESDCEQLSDAKSGIEKLFKIGYRKFFYKDTIKNYPTANIHDIHENSGIAAFSQGYKLVNYWHRKSLKNLLKNKE